MKKILVWLVASLLLTMVGCVEGLQEPDVTETSSEQLPDLTAGFAEGKTKTYVESGKYLRWHEDDRLTAFYGNTRNRQYKFNGATGDNSGSFSFVPSGNLETGNALDRIYAVYPYDETATITDDGQISLTLPAVQTYAENSFGRGANTMLAATENVEDTFLGFKNACGYLKLKFYNADGATIKSIEVKGNGDEKIAGVATATIDFGEVPQLTMADDATTAITLDGGEGVALGTTAETATEFWVVIPETTFKGGITITVTDTEGSIFEKSTTKEVVIERNAVQPMAALGVEFVAPVAKPANNEIWYTNGSTTEATTPSKTDVFGANIVSNTYDAEKECWVIKFDGDVTSIGDNAFSNRSSLTSITIPDSVTSIGTAAFSNCSSLTRITIPDSVTSIGRNAFYYCTGELIVNCNIPSASEYKYGAFYYSEFTSVTIGDSVTSIGDHAFYRCSSIASITIPDSVTSIGNYAFKNCSSLTSVTIPDSVTEIGRYAFQGCSSLIEFNGKYASEDGRCIIIEGILKSFASAGLTEYTIPDSVTEIGSSAFEDCTKLTSVTIPDSVTSIGSYAFYNCYKLTSVTIPDDVTFIGIYAFSRCFALTSVYCKPKTPPTSNDYMFYENAVDRKIYVPINSVDAYMSNEYWGDWYGNAIQGYNFVKPANTEIYYTNGSTTEATTPYATDVFGATIVSNTYDADKECWVIKFDGAVTEIGGSAFYGCSSLTSVTIPDSVTEIGNGAFDNCSSLASITMGNSVKEIQGAFIGCISLTSVIIPNSVTTIGSYAFQGCSSLTKFSGKFATEDGRCLIVNGKLKSFAPAGLTTYTIPSSVTTIGYGTFHGCTNLTNVVIPSSVTTIEDYAFYYCTSLKSVYCYATTPPSLGVHVFDHASSGNYEIIDCDIYVPANSVEAYKAARYWKNHASNIVGR